MTPSNDSSLRNSYVIIEEEEEHDRQKRLQLVKRYDRKDHYSFIVEAEKQQHQQQRYESLRWISLRVFSLSRRSLVLLLLRLYTCNRATTTTAFVVSTGRRNRQRPLRRTPILQPQNQDHQYCSNQRVNNQQIQMRRCLLQQQQHRIVRVVSTRMIVSFIVILIVAVVVPQQESSCSGITCCTALMLLPTNTKHTIRKNNMRIRNHQQQLPFRSSGSSFSLKSTPNTKNNNNNNDGNTLLESLSSIPSTKQLHQYTIKELRDMIVTYSNDTPTTTTTTTASTTTGTKSTTVSVLQNVNDYDDTNNSGSSTMPSSSTSANVSWSKLKRKQDYIDYLLQLQQQQQQTKYVENNIQQRLPQIPIPILDVGGTVVVNSKKRNGVLKKEGAVGAPGKPLQPQPLYSKQRRVSSMPPLTTTTNQNHYQTPKDIIVEEVYERYPPLRPQQQQSSTLVEMTMPHHEYQIATSSSMAVNTNNNNNNILDVRQEYHPVMRQLALIHGSRTDNDNDADVTHEQEDESENTSTAVNTNINASPMTATGMSSISSIQSDMDIVCIGTASCTPGITRGVSCTAIRCNWNRRSSSSSSSSNAVSSLTTISGTSMSSRGLEPHPTSHTVNGSHLINNGAATTTIQSGTWIFDVGECTQLQIQKTTSVKPGKITKIFLTHAHGDHTFGLPGLLCLMGQDRSSDAPVVDVYGPEGLRMWLRTAIRYSVSRIVPPYRVHEIMNIPMAPPWEYNPRSRRYYYKGAPENAQWNAHKGLAGEDMTNWISQSTQITIESSNMYGEMDGGRSIYPIYNHPQSVNGAPIWLLEDDEDVQVFAAPMSHGIPCVGYVIQEQPRAGRLRNEYVEPIVQRNKAALIQAGYPAPMRALAVVKNLPIGATFTFPDGTIVRQEDAVEPERTGRKIVICGDTSCAMALSKLAYQADVIIHEATNAYLSGVDTKDATLSQVTRDAIVHGHSTPQMAAQFCRKVQGQLLLLNHFSARYKGDPSVDSLSIMLRIEKQACHAAKYNDTQVIAAWDMMILPIPQH